MSNKNRTANGVRQVGVDTLSSGSHRDGASSRTGTVGAVTGAASGNPGIGAPGNSGNFAGTLNASGNVALTAQSILDIQLGGTTAAQYDKVNVTGTASPGGAWLQGALINAFIPAVGDAFTILHSTGRHHRPVRPGHLHLHQWQGYC